MARKKTTINVKKLLDTANSFVGLITDEKLQRTMFGTYSDGTPRSMMDSLNGEVLSPKDKKKRVYKKKKNKKKRLKIKL